MSVLVTRREYDAIMSISRDGSLISDATLNDRSAAVEARTEKEFDRERAVLRSDKTKRELDKWRDFSAKFRL